MSSSHAIAIPKRRKQPQPEHDPTVTGMGMGISLSPSTSSSNSHTSSMAASAPAGSSSTSASALASTNISAAANGSSSVVPGSSTTAGSAGRGSHRRLSMGYRHSHGSGTNHGQSFYGHERRPSLLSSSISKSEHTVVNIGDSESPRLITCIKASQGFDWNQDLFLPSYADYDGIDLETRQDPVEDIVLTEEEIEAMFPR